MWYYRLFVLHFFITIFAVCKQWFVCVFNIYTCKVTKYFATMQENVQNISPIKSRILQFVDTLNISKRAFYAKIGVSRGTLESKTGITESVITKFIAEYPDLSAEWLLRGTGDMFLSSGPGQQVNAHQNNGTINATNYASAAADECRRLAEENKFLREELANKQRLIDYFTTQKN